MSSAPFLAITKALDTIDAMPMPITPEQVQAMEAIAKRARRLTGVLRDRSHGHCAHQCRQIIKSTDGRRVKRCTCCGEEREDV